MVVKELAPATEVTEEPYLYKLLKAPVLSGWALGAFTRIYETQAFGSLVYGAISPQSGVHQVLHDIVLPEQPLFLPHCPVSEYVEEPGCVSLEGDALDVIVSLPGLMPELHTAPQAVDADSIGVSLTQGNVEQSISGQPTGTRTDEQTIEAPATGAADKAPGTYRRPTIADYVAAYRSGVTTPIQVAERILEFMGRSSQAGCAWFVATSDEAVRQQAKESAARWAAGKPLSFLDGVPYAVKDVLDAEPYATTVGTSFAAERWPSSGNAPYIVALRQAGAILLGKTTLHEIGLGITGLNLRTGTALNPYNHAHFTGGSSSGSAAVLGAGLCPIAIGTDGGGSIRIPSSFCGVTGLKPTNGRVTAEGSFRVDCTVAVLGPMAASVQDAVIMYSIMANHDAWYTHAGERMPEARLPQPMITPGPSPLAGSKAGVYWPWFSDAAPEVVAACKDALTLMQASGLAVQDVACIPELEHLRVAHNVTIVSEMLHCFQAVWDDPKQRALFSADVRVGLDTARFWTPCDYLQAQRVRQRATTHFRRAMADVDVLVTPTVPCTAPAIPRGALTGGCSDLGQVSLVTRFAIPANMLGLPAISVPVGVDSKGLPIGIQLIAKPWHEATLVRIAGQLEAALKVKAAASGSKPIAGIPHTWIDPLTGASAGI